MDTRIFDELEVCFEQELSLAGTDLGTLESAVTAFIRQLGQGSAAKAGFHAAKRV